MAVSSHLTVVELEVEHLEVLPDALGGHGFRDRHIAELQVPAKHDLSRGLAVRLRHGVDRRVLEQPLPLADRAPGLGRDLVLAVVRAQLVLRKAWVQLDLVDSRDDGRLGPEPVQVWIVKLETPDGPGPARPRRASPVRARSRLSLRGTAVGQWIR